MKREGLDIQERVSFAGAQLDDPLAEGLAANPYNVLSGVEPNMPVRRINQVMQMLQRRKLRPEEGPAFRILRDRARRLSWDLLTLGTAPSFDDQAWAKASSLLRSGTRDEAWEFWARLSLESDSGLQYCAVLATNELAWLLIKKKRPSQQSFTRFLAFWAALLHRRKWLERFADYRCQIWKAPEPDPETKAVFIERVEQQVTSLLNEANSEVRDDWLSLWLRERAAIEATHKTIQHHVPEGWTKGFGPLGLTVLARDQPIREWLLKASRPYQGGLPLTALKAGKARFDPRDPTGSSEAATALQWLFSSLGSIAAQVWKGHGRAAWLAVVGFRSGQRSKGVAQRSDVWFGEGRGSQLRQARALAEIKAEALLLYAREELGNPKVPAHKVMSTCERVLQAAGALRQPLVVTEQLESLLTGRLQDCLESVPAPSSLEVQRIAKVSLQVRQRLVDRGGGGQIASKLARLLKRHAVSRWNASGNALPKPAVQIRVLQDLLLASELAPHQPDIVLNLARVALQIEFVSTAEQKGLLSRVNRLLESTAQAGRTSMEIEECRLQILERIDPDRAKAEARQMLDRIRLNEGNESGPREA